MTNYDHFVNMTRGLPAPQIYLDVAWYFSVSAALERRVWFGDSARPLRANQFVLFVGPPGIGKGLALRESNRLLSKYPMLDPKGQIVIDPTTHKERPRFYQMPDATSFEQLCHEVAASRAIFKIGDHEETHCSTYFLLEELSSLFRLKKSEDIARLLLNMYDNQPFKYKVIRTGGSAIIDKGCMNFIAGTTLGFMKEAENTGMIGEGLASRFLIVHAFEQRHVRFGLPEMTDDQRASEKHLQKWLFALSRVHGQALVLPETEKWLQDWWIAEDKHLKDFEDEKLLNFFSRRQVQVTKLAMARHFSESLDMTLTTDDFIWASQFVRSLEPNVVEIARRSGRNAEYSVQENFIRWINRHPGQDHAAVVARLAPDLDMAAIVHTLTLLQQARAIKLVDDKYYPFELELPKRQVTPAGIVLPISYPTDQLTDKTAGSLPI